MTVRTLIVMPLAEQRGGAELMLQQLLQHRAAAGIDPTVAFLRDGPMVEWCTKRGISAVVIDAGRLRQARRLGATIRALADLARRTRADVILGWMAKAQLYGGPAAALAQIPCVWLQSGLPAGSAALDRLATLLPADCVITLANHVQAAQRRLWPHRHTVVVYPAVDLQRFDPERIGDPASIRSRLELPLNAPVYGAVGRLDRWKGFHHLLAAAPHVVHAHPDATLVLVGGPHELDPDYAVGLQEQARQLNLNGQVRLVGQQPNPEEWMQAMDVVLHTSDTEPFGIVVIEAMALGKPVIAGAAGGPSEIITPGHDGFLSPFGEPDELAAHVVRLLGDEALRRRTGDAARRRAHDFSVEHYARQLGAVVAATMSQGAKE